MNKWGFYILVILVLSLALTGCAPGQLLGPTFTPTPTATSTPTATPLPTSTPVPTDTPVPTATENWSYDMCTDSGGDFITLPALSITGTLSKTSCFDVWSFTLNKGSVIQITMLPTTNDMSPDFSLMTTANDSCTSCADMTTLTNSKDSPSQAALTYTMPYSGDYYLVLGSNNTPPSGSYSLEIKLLSQGAVPTKVPVQPTKQPAQATRVSPPTSTQGSAQNLGTVPVTITNNTSHRMKIIAVGPVSYTVMIDGKTTLEENWAPGNYTLTAYYDTGEFYASTNYDVNENHALFTLN